MITRQIREGLHYIGVVDRNRRGFIGKYFTSDGVMYGSYLMTAEPSDHEEESGACAIIGTVPSEYVSEWLEEVRRCAGDTAPSWCVIFGLEQEIAAVRAMVRVWPKIRLIGSCSALYRLEELTERPFERIEIRTDRRVMIGGRELQFHIGKDTREFPSLYVIDRAAGCLFTADAFNALYAAEEVLLSRTVNRSLDDGPDGPSSNSGFGAAAKQQLASGSNQMIASEKSPSRISPPDAASDGAASAASGWLEGARGYCSSLHEDIDRISARQLAAMIEDNGISMICPALGPVVDAAPTVLASRAEELYRVQKPSGASASDVRSAAIVYESGGYLEEIVLRIAAGVKEAGDIRVCTYNLSEVSREDVLRGIAECDALLLGTTQICDDAAGSVWDIAVSLGRTTKSGQLAAVIAQGQPDGSAALQLRIRLGERGYDISWKDFRVIGKPDGKVMEYAEDYGYGLGCRLLQIPNDRSPSLVRCLVCGEVFDASLGVCPVCGVGLDQCVPADGDDTMYHQNSDRRYVVLGGGTAGVSAAEAIRLRDDTGRIDLISAEEELPINRPMLTKDVDAAAGAEETMFLHEGTWYEDRGIVLHLGCRAEKIDTEQGVVVTEDGSRYPYDRLIYAMGAECFIPPFAGWDKPGVLTIRHLKDCAELKRRMSHARRAVVIGGGVLGLEAASEIMRSGIAVTVLEASPQIIGRQADAETAQILMERMRRMRIDCYQGVSIAGVEGESSAEGVRLQDGRYFPADFVVVSCGNRGNIRAAQEAGIRTERAVVVNARMETSAENVYACGDCAQMDGLNYQLWQEASEQGRVAGANAAGDDVRYAHSLLGLSLEGFGTSLFAIGDPGKKENIPYKALEIRDEVRSRREKYWFFGDQLQGAVLIDSPEKIAAVTQDVREHVSYTEMTQRYRR